MAIAVSYGDPLIFEQKLQVFLERRRAVDPTATLSPPALRQIFEACVRRLFADAPQVLRVVVDLVQGGDVGRSPRLLLKLISYEAEAVIHMRVVAHFGTAQVIADQVDRWRRFCTAISDYSAQLLQEVRHEAGYGLITWTFLRGRSAPDRPLQTLLDQLRDPAYIRRNESIQRSILLLKDLFTDALGGRSGAAPSGPAGGTAWHNDSVAHPDTPPLHFYNMVLPPLLTLHDVHWSAAATLELPTLSPATLDRADADPQWLQPGAQVAIRCGPGGFTLRPDPRKSGRLLLFPAGYDPQQEQGKRRPVRPLLARIALETPLADLPETGVLIGTIRATRPADLRDADAQIRRHLPADQRRGLHRAERFFLNPVEAYAAIMTRPLTLRTSIIHGDLNLSNILVDVGGSAESPQPMLIDFEWTEAGGHTAFDLIKLEVEYRTKVLAGAVEHVDQLLLLETALFQGLRGESAPLRDLLADVQRDLPLAHAYTFIKTVRDFAFSLRISPAEYYVGLLGYSLAVLKWQELYASPEAGADAGPLPAAVLAYVCAACTASFFDEVRPLPAPPALPDLAAYQADDHVLVIGRHELIERISVELTTNRRPVVWLKSVPLNGLAAVGATVVARLAARGWRSLGGAERTTATLLDLLQAVITQLTPAQQPAFLQSLQPNLKRPAFQELRLAAPTADVAPLPKGVSARYRADEVCRALVRMLEQTGQSWLITLHMGEATDELADLAGLLQAAVKAPIALLILDDRDEAQVVTGVPRGFKDYTLPVWGEADVQRYLDRQGLRDDPQLAGQLLAVGHQLPELIHALVGELVEYSAARIAQTIAAFRRGRIDIVLEDWVRRLGSPIRTLLAFEWLLSDNTRLVSADPTSSADETRRTERARHQQLVEAYARSGQIAATEAEIAAYLRLLLRHTPGVVSALQHSAYLQLRAEGAPLRRMSAWLAGWLREHTELAGDGFVIARYLQLAGRPEEALAQIFAERHDPEERFSTTHCRRLSALFEVLTEYTSRQPDPQREILILAGSYELHVGNLVKARDYFQQGTVGAQHDPLYGSISQIKLWQIYDVYEHTQQYAELDDLCGKMLQDHTLAEAMRRLVAGIQTYAQFMGGSLDSDLAHPQMQTLIAAIGQPIASWPAIQRPFFYQQYVLLQDLAAKMLFIDNQFSEARLVIEQMLPQIVAKPGRPPVPAHLQARIESNYGLLLFTDPAHPDDLRTARNYLERALRRRDTLGDRLGQQRTGVNLANLYRDLATSAAGWHEARKLYEDYLALVQQQEVETFESVRLKGNLIELLIRQGAFREAAPLLPVLDPANVTAGHLFGHIIHARLAVWQGDLSRATDYTLAHQHVLFPAAAEGAEESMPAATDDQLSWLQNGYELIWMGRLLDARWRPDPALERIIFAGRLPEPGPGWDGPITQAELACAIGMQQIARGALADGLPAQALFAAGVAQLGAARAQWARFGYHYLAALAGLWQVAGLAWSDRQAEAGALAATLVREGRPFGDTIPVMRLLARTLS